MLDLGSKEYVMKNPVRGTIANVGYMVTIGTQTGIEVLHAMKTATEIVNLSMMPTRNELKLESLESQLAYMDREDELLARLNQRKGGKDGSVQS